MQIIALRKGKERRVSFAYLRSNVEPRKPDG